MDTATLVGYGVAIVIAVLIFLVLREVFCWYWKLNKIVSLLEEIRDRLPKPVE